MEKNNKNVKSKYSLRENTGFCGFSFARQEGKWKNAKNIDFLCVEKTGWKLCILHKKYRQFWRKEEISKNRKCKIKLPQRLVGQKTTVKVVTMNKKYNNLRSNSKARVNKIYQSDQSRKNIAKMTIFKKREDFFYLWRGAEKGLEIQEIAWLFCLFMIIYEYDFRPLWAFYALWGVCGTV